MKLVISMMAVGLLAGCAMPDRKVAKSPAAERKVALKQCVRDFLHEDVPPTSSLNICESIYKRWEVAD